MNLDQLIAALEQVETEVKEHSWKRGQQVTHVNMPYGPLMEIKEQLQKLREMKA